MRVYKYLDVGVKFNYFTSTTNKKNRQPKGRRSLKIYIFVYSFLSKVLPIVSYIIGDATNKEE